MLIDSLVGYYKLDEAANTDAVDVHAGKNLTDQGVGTAPGKINTCRAFIGENYTALYRDDTSFRFTGDMTVQAWIYTTAVGSNDAGTGSGVVAHLSNDSIGDWMLTVNASGVLAFGYFSSPTSNPIGAKRTAPGTIANGNWYHCVARKVGSVFSIFVNGVNTAFSVTGLSSGFGYTGFCIGELITFMPSLMFWGLIDEVAVWGRGLSDVEVGKLNNGMAGLPYPLEETGPPPPLNALASDYSRRYSGGSLTRIPPPPIVIAGRSLPIGGRTSGRERVIAGIRSTAQDTARDAAALSGTIAARARSNEAEHASGAPSILSVVKIDTRARSVVVPHDSASLAASVDTRGRSLIVTRDRAFGFAAPEEIPLPGFLAAEATVVIGPDPIGKHVQPPFTAPTSRAEATVVIGPAADAKRIAIGNINAK